MGRNIHTPCNSRPALLLGKGAQDCSRRAALPLRGRGSRAGQAAGCARWPEVAASPAVFLVALAPWQPAATHRAELITLDCASLPRAAGGRRGSEQGSASRVQRQSTAQPTEQASNQRGARRCSSARCNAQHAAAMRSTRPLRFTDHSGSVLGGLGAGRDAVAAAWVLLETLRSGKEGGGGGGEARRPNEAQTRRLGTGKRGGEPVHTRGDHILTICATLQTDSGACAAASCNKRGRSGLKTAVHAAGRAASTRHAN